MDDQAGEGDDYSDNDLDALPAHTLHQLQEHAIQSTQQPSLGAHGQLPGKDEPIGLPGGLGRLSVARPASHAANQHGLHAPSSDYGDFDEEMLDGEIFDAADESGDISQREQWRLQRYGANQRYVEPVKGPQRVNGPGAVGSSGSDSNHRGNTGWSNGTGQIGSKVYLANQMPSGPPPEENTDVNALQAQVQKVGLLKLFITGMHINCLYLNS